MIKKLTWWRVILAVTLSHLSYGTWGSTYMYASQGISVFWTLRKCLILLSLFSWPWLADVDLFFDRIAGESRRAPYSSPFSSWWRSRLSPRSWTIIARARMGSESIAHEADGTMGYWLRAHECERNNCLSKIQLLGPKNIEAKHLVLIKARL